MCTKFVWPCATISDDQGRGGGVYVNFLGNLFEDSELETFGFNSFQKSRSSRVGRTVEDR